MPVFAPPPRSGATVRPAVTIAPLTKKIDKQRAYPESVGFVIHGPYGPGFTQYLDRWPAPRPVWRDVYKAFVTGESLVECTELVKFARACGWTWTPEAEEYVMRILDRARTRVLASSLPAADWVPGLERLGGKLRPYQVAAVAFAQHTGRIYLADQMGLGKSVEALGILAVRDTYRCIIACPVNAIDVWINHIEGNTNLGIAEWLPRRKLQRVTSRKVPLDPSCDLHLMTYGVMTAKADEIAADVGIRAFVADEAAALKNHGAQRTAAAMKICQSIRAREADPTILLLSGTAVENAGSDIIAPIQMLGWEGEFGGLSGLKARCYKGAPLKALQEVGQQARGLFFVRRTREDVKLEIPGLTRSPRSVALSNRDDYKKAHDSFLEWLAAHGGDVDRAARAERLVRLGALRKLTGDGKVAGAQEWIRSFFEEGDGGRLLVFAHHRTVIEALAGALPEPNSTAIIYGGTEARERGKIAERFQTDPSLKMLVLSTRSGGEALTLTAASDVAFIELDWTSSKMEQAESRAHRWGQSKPVVAHYLLAPDSIDEVLWQVLQEKRLMGHALLDGALDIEEENAVDGVVKRMLAGAGP